MTVIGENIKKLRERAGYSVRKLSELSGVSKSVISEIETGKAQNPRYETLAKIAKSLNTPVENITELEIEHEYLITDLKEAIEIILSQENLTLDGVLLSNSDKTVLQKSLNMALDFVREMKREKK